MLRLAANALAARVEHRRRGRRVGRLRGIRRRGAAGLRDHHQAFVNRKQKLISETVPPLAPGSCVVELSLGLSEEYESASSLRAGRPSFARRPAAA